MHIQRVVMTGPRALDVVRDTLDDAPPAPHEVVLRTRYSLISPGTELAHYAGTADLSRHIPAQPYPWSPGYAAVGDVLAAGAEAGVAVGDLVLAHTPHQSAARFDSRHRVCRRVPEGVPPPAATLGRLGQVSAVAIRTSAARAGQWAAVIGLGLVGACAAQLLRAAGLRVVGVETMPQRRALAARSGLALTVDPRQDGALEEAVARTGGCRLVLECSGQPRGLQTGLALAAHHGEVALVGAAWWRDTEVLATDIVRPVFDKFLTLRSGWEWQIPLYADGPQDSIAACTDWVLSCLREGSVSADTLITDTVSPGEVATAYERLLDDPAAHLGVVIDWTRHAP
jgi:2-desacetyl-2-hydroxyethyl bacteriochlorophyllide A dehydrogenase